MFARQIAVMKGQAWNVVETLKTSDHGPLELTRRTRVCVWDDLVDIPVAIPMRTPSSEMRRRRENLMKTEAEEEEMDISAVNATSSRKQPDLLGSPTELPTPNRFDLTRNNSSSDLAHLNDTSLAPVNDEPSLNRSITIEDSKMLHGSSLPSKTKTRFSLDKMKRHHRRNSSSGRFGNVFLGDADDLEGDLGYSVAEGMEGSRRKVIQERLETVKSKNPVFTWC